MAVCTFSFEEMLNEEGNTFVYLLNTQVRNRSFTKKHRKDIDELKKASELTLGEGEIWEEGEERVLVLHLLEFTQVIALSCVLVLHLLEFTQVIALSCYPVLPHKLCEYLYDLPMRFNSYCDSWKVGIAETKLLLCKATEV
ncbi:arginine--tRNA ligase, chloroplastic/mitochondrial, partial [Tanacetum coccineum]